MVIIFRQPWEEMSFYLPIRAIGMAIRRRDYKYSFHNSIVNEVESIYLLYRIEINNVLRKDCIISLSLLSVPRTNITISKNASDKHPYRI